MPIPPRTTPWEAPNNVMGTEKLCQNILDLVARDQVEALAWANTGNPGTLASFIDLNNAVRINSRWPVFTAAPSSEEANESNSGSFYPTKYVVHLEVEDSGPNPDLLVKTIQRRVRTVRAIIRGANIMSELFADFDVADFGVPTLTFSAVAYTSFLSKNQSTYFQYATFNATFDLLET